MKTQLFIENKEVELTDDVQFLLNKQFEDITNPTVIINDWSKTISIPFTESNNRLFGYIYRTDRIISSNGTEDSYKLMNIYFDPTKKLDFKLVYNSFDMMAGYAKMNDITQTAGKGTYNITLFGQLGKVFQEMQKITFDKSYDASNYVIDGAKYVSEYINKDLVASSWQSNGQEHSELYPKYIIPGPGAAPVIHPNYNVTDIIGFAPNNSFSEGFEHNTFQMSSTTSEQFAQYLNDHNFEASTGINADTVIPNGLLPREIGEYRSYLQLPFIYWNKLFKVFQNKAEDITGYQFDLDSSWFNTSNPYWNNLVYMLKPLNLKQEENATNYYNFAAWTIGWGNDISEYTTEQIQDLYLQKVQETIPVVDSSNLYIDLSNNYDVVFNTSYTIDFDVNNWNNLKINPNNGLVFSIAVVDEDSNVLEEFKYLMVDNDYTGSQSGYKQVISVGREGSGGWTVYPMFTTSMNKGKYNRDKVRLKLKAVWLNSNAPFLDANNNPFIPTPTTTYWRVGLHIYSLPQNNPIPCVVTKNYHRSYGYFNLNDLWNNDYNIFDEILKYCKIYRICVAVDEINKKITFRPFNKYFENYSIADWTNFVDKSKDFSIKPITFENKYVMFNYKDSETKLGKEYKEKFGVNYGEYRLITDYNFNDDTTELFNDIKQAFVNTDNCLSFLNLGNHKIIYSLPNEITVYNKDKDNKQVDVFGSFFFHNGLANWSNETALNLIYPVKVSDDSNYMQYNNTYFYTFLQTDYNTLTTYPKLDVVYGDNMCLFNIPKENYTYLSNYYDKKSIYYNFWKSYINERYNIQNKLITCYVTFTPEMWNEFDYNQFVIVDNQLCFVNKIYDYDITNNESTKVDLITIQDVSGYTSNNYV